MHFINFMIKQGLVYLIYDPSQNLYKIGVTRGKEEIRLKQLQTGNASKLQIIYTYETEFPYRLETMLHNRFKLQQVLNEWYDLPTDVVLNFKNICLDTDNIINMLKDNYFFTKKLR